MKTYYGNYLGIVIDNNDPEFRGRVQVFIPHIMPTLYEDWNKKGENITLTCVADNVPDGLKSEIVERLKKILPWSEAASPIIGQSGPGSVSGGLAAAMCGAGGSPTPIGGTVGTTGSASSQAAPGDVSGVVSAGPGWTTVQLADGSVERRDGTRGWRNNNPGNLEYGSFAKRYGAVGTDGRHAVFPTYEAGRKAKEALLFESPNYKNLTIEQAIYRYAPPSENNSSWYAQTVANAAAGGNVNTPVSQLTTDQRTSMLNAMEKVEGFKTGKVTQVSGPTGEGTAAAGSTSTGSSGSTTPGTTGTGAAATGTTPGATPGAAGGTNMGPCGGGVGGGNYLDQSPTAAPAGQLGPPGEACAIPIQHSGVDLRGLKSVYVQRLNGFYREATSLGYKITCTSAWRSYQKQAQLYADAIKKNPKKPGASPPGNSTHELGLATDLIVTGNGVAITNLSVEASAKGINKDTPAFRALLAKYNLHQPLHPSTGASTPEHWHVEPIECPAAFKSTQYGTRGDQCFLAVAQVMSQPAQKLVAETTSSSQFPAAANPLATSKPENTGLTAAIPAKST